MNFFLPAFRRVRPLALGLISVALSACAPSQTTRQPGPELAQIQQAFGALPAPLRDQLSGLTFTSEADGGTLVSGQLDRIPFNLRFPAHWNHQSLVFAHGYELPSPQPDHLSADPVAQDESAGLLTAAYNQGLVVGQSAYDKRGFAVASAIQRTVHLSQLLSALGAQRAYIAGGSQGGSVAELAIERYPQQFSGAVAACGVVGGWEKEVNFTTHIRALYNYFAAGTAYALPGNHDVTRAAGVSQNALLLTLTRLYTAARLNPHGQAAAIINRTMSAVPEVQAQGDLATLVGPLLTQVAGVEDFSAQVGGIFVSNTHTVYHSDLLNPAENQALNAGIQRYQADPAATQKAREQFTPSGQFSAKLLSFHNAYDPLVPAEHEVWLRQQVEAAHNTGNLLQMTFPTAYARFPTKLIGFQSATHCGFTHAQTALAWNTLQRWVETGQKPAADRQN